MVGFLSSIAVLFPGAVIMFGLAVAAVAWQEPFLNLPERTEP